MKPYNILVNMVLTLAIIWLFTACTDATAPATEEGPTTIEDLTEKPVIYKADWPNNDYTELVVEAIEDFGDDLLEVTPLDAKDYGFKATTKEEKRQFYIMLISAMARYESNFKPEVNAYECRKNSCVYSSCRKVEGRGYCMLGGHKLDGGLVISRGLMQISLESAQGYGCNVEKPEQLNDPRHNLRCAVRILNRFVAKDKYIGTVLKNKDGSKSYRGGARYWSVLRETSEARPKILAKVKAI